jgi:hypothetical protein
MPYSEPSFDPKYAGYYASFTTPTPWVRVAITSDYNHNIPSTEAERDDAMQAVVDALSSLPGWTFNEAGKNYTAAVALTATPVEED